MCSNSQLTADCCCAVILKANNIGTVLYCAGVYRCGATERGNVSVVLVGAEGYCPTPLDPPAGNPPSKPTTSLTGPPSKPPAIPPTSVTAPFKVSPTPPDVTQPSISGRKYQ